MRSRKPGAGCIGVTVRRCPCVYPNNAASNARWCCGDYPHLDLSQWALEKVRAGRTTAFDLQHLWKLLLMLCLCGISCTAAVRRMVCMCCAMGSLQQQACSKQGHLPRTGHVSLPRTLDGGPLTVGAAAAAVQIAQDTDRWGVFAIQYRRVDCSAPVADGQVRFATPWSFCIDQHTVSCLLLQSTGPAA